MRYEYIAVFLFTASFKSSLPYVVHLLRFQFQRNIDWIAIKDSKERARLSRVPRIAALQHQWCFKPESWMLCYDYLRSWIVQKTSRNPAVVSLSLLLSQFRQINNLPMRTQLGLVSFPSSQCLLYLKTRCCLLWDHLAKDYFYPCRLRVQNTWFMRPTSKEKATEEWIRKTHFFSSR